MLHSATQCHAQKVTILPSLPHLILLGWEICLMRLCVCVCFVIKVATGGFLLCPHLDLVVASVAGYQGPPE